jgi:hypothetical protein
VPDFDTSVPHIARIHDYWLGGCFLSAHAVATGLGQRSVLAILAILSDRCPLNS